LLFCRWPKRHGKIIVGVAARHQFALINVRILVVVGTLILTTCEVIIEVMCLDFFTTIAVVTSIAVVASIFFLSCQRLSCFELDFFFDAV
jgi:hypothetical protein